MAEKSVNKVVIDNKTVIDITDTTATPETVAAGETFYMASGAKGTGTRTFVTGVKGDSESSYRTGDVNLTKDNLGLSNVDNKSSETIRSELTKSNVTTALGFTPYTQAEVDALVSAVFHYKGTKATYAEVAALTDMVTGDVWQVSADNSEYVYNGSTWEKLGPTIDLSGYLTSVSVAGQTLTPGSNTITATQLKTALGLGSAAYANTESALTDGTNLPTGAAVTAAISDAVDFGTVGSEGNPVYFNNGTPEPIAFTFGIDADNNMNVSWDGDAPEPVIPTGAALAIESGGTGATTAAEARTNLGLGSAATYNVVSSVNDDSNLVTGGAIKRYYEAVGIPSAICTTSSATASKVATCSSFSLLAKSYIQVILANENTAESALTLDINDTGVKPIAINGEVSSATNYTLPAGAYFVYYDGSNYYFRTDGKLTGDITGNAATATSSTYADTAGSASTALSATNADHSTTSDSATTASTADNALKVNNHTVEKDVPSDAVFTDTTDLTLMTGTLEVSHGGTGQTSLQATRNAMGLGNTTGALPIANGGTGATTVGNARAALGFPTTYSVQEITGAGTYTFTFRSAYAPAFMYGINASYRFVAIIQPGGGNPSIDRLFGTGTLPTLAAGTSSNQIKITFTAGVDTIVSGPILSITSS